MEATRPAMVGVAVGRWEPRGPKSKSKANRGHTCWLQVAARELLKTIRSRERPSSTDSWCDYWAPDVFVNKAVVVASSDLAGHLPPVPEFRGCSDGAQEGADPADEAVGEKVAESGCEDCHSSAPSRWPTSQMTAVAASGSFLVGLQAATLLGVGQGMPNINGVLSAALAASGSVSCVYAVGRPPAANVVELPAWVTCALACLCGGLAPLPLVPLSEASLAGVTTHVRLALPGALGAAAMFEVAHRYWARVDPGRVAVLCELERGTPDGQGAAGRWTLGGLNSQFLQAVQKHWWRHFSPAAFAKSDRGVGAVFLVIQLAVTGFAVHIDFAMTTWRQTFFNSLQAKDALAFHRQLWDFLPIALASTIASIYDGYLTTMWDLRWREELTQDFMNVWLPHRAEYYAKLSREGGQACDGPIDNFDQRLAEDTAVFASNSRSLICGAAAALMRLAVFGPALIRLSPTPLVWEVCLALSVASSLMTHAVGHPLSLRSAALQRAEADFRTALMRVRLLGDASIPPAAAEPQAAAPAQAQAQAADGAEEASASFEGVKAATWLAARGTLQLSTFTSAYSLVAGIIPFLVLVPSYFHGDITLGTMFQIEGIVGGVRQSLDFFIGAYSDIAVWRAATNRLLALEACASGAAALKPLSVCTQPVHRADGDSREPASDDDA